MPRESRIRWTESQWRRLDSAVRKYNNAIRRELKKVPNASIYLPEEVSYKELKSSITTARALKNVVNRLNRITREGALTPVRQDDGSIVTKYERHEYAILRSVRERAKSQRAKQLKLKPVAPGSIGSYEQAKATPDKRKIKTLSAKSLRRFIETQEREMNLSSMDKLRRYYSNYIDALYSVFGGFSDYDKELAEIVAIIEGKSRTNPASLFDDIDEAPSIRYIYDPILRATKMDLIYEYWTGR